MKMRNGMWWLAAGAVSCAAFTGPAAAMGRTNEPTSIVQKAQTSEHTGSTGGASNVSTTNSIGGKGRSEMELGDDRARAAGNASLAPATDVTGGIQKEQGGAAKTSGAKEEGKKR